MSHYIWGVRNSTYYYLNLRSFRGNNPKYFQQYKFNSRLALNSAETELEKLGYFPGSINIIFRYPKKNWRN